MIIGIDEAGRGPLAGPVVAAGVILDPKNIITGLADSKKLGEKQREILYDQIMSRAVFVCVSQVSPDIIDKINILQATLRAMGEVLVKSYEKYPEITAQIDGNQIIKNLVHIKQESIIKGDSLIPSIMAASVIAKVTRDRLMFEYHEKYPEYNFAKHKGYGTKAHMQAINTHGPCAIHRMSFAPLKSGVLGL